MRPPRRALDRTHVRVALEVYLEGAVAWPTRDTMTEDGLRGLLSAIEPRGGARGWAAEFGLPGGGVVGRASPPEAGWRARRSEAGVLSRFLNAGSLMTGTRERDGIGAADATRHWPLGVERHRGQGSRPSAGAGRNALLEVGT